MNLADAPIWCLAVLAALLGAAAVEDALRLKISNVTTAANLVLGLITIVVMGPRVEVWQNVAVFASLLTVGTILFSYGKLGGGDVKLLAAAGLWFPIAQGLQMLLAVTLAGGALGLLILLARTFRQSDRQSPVLFLNRGAGIPYGVAIAGGVLFALMMQRGDAKSYDPTAIPSVSSLRS